MSEDSAGGTGDLLAGLGTGSRVAGYVLGEQVGAGGMAVVFRAVDERLGRHVALKILAPALTADQAFRQRFLRESRAAASVDDPHIIPIYEAGEAGGVLFIAMRYVPGRDARTLLYEVGPLNPGRVTSIISPVASALDAAHDASLVHRDVKPANILVDARPGRPDHVYLSDFGLSKGALSSVGLTGAGQFLGTPNYTAPEQIEGKQVDGRADQYALACTAFELLTGDAPFQRDQGMAVIWAHLQQPPPSLSSRRPGLPSEADQVFDRALAKTPELRYASCTEFADALRSALGHAPYDSVPGLLPQEVHPPTQLAPLADQTDADRKVAAARPDNSADKREGVSSTDVGPTDNANPGGVPGVRPAGDKTEIALTGHSDEPATLGGMPQSSTDPITVAVSGPEPETTLPPISPLADAERTAATRRSRRRITVAVTLATALASLTAGVVAWAPWRSPVFPVLRPDGLVADASTANSVAFSWSGPASGPVPDRYEILQDGQMVAFVPGNVTFYRDAGLAPAASYQMQVIAIRNGKHSRPSAVLNTGTQTPPISAAVLSGTWTVHFRTTAAYPQDSLWPITTVGKRWTDSWTFTTDCAIGPCRVTLSGTFDGASFTASLARSGAVYSGVTRSRNFEYCSYASNTVRDTLDIRIHVAAAGAQGQIWTANSWVGNVTLHAPYAPIGNCYADTIRAKVRSA